ncbi:MAG: GIY-YIG nuclease family protein [Clostridiales Family XIII bacterium]|nr:GIY-YIG nuclease family protein [Clostridiales Family XIII bacterium]
MDNQKASRKELIDAYKLMKVNVGVYQIKNTKNDKIFVDSCNNLKNRWMTIKMMLNDKRHPNRLLQTDWNELGEAAFAYEVLEEKEIEPDLSTLEKKNLLTDMRAKWLEELQPYENRGYNKRK